MVYRIKSDSQANPDKQIQPDKERDCVFAYSVCKKQGLR